MKNSAILLLSTSLFLSTSIAEPLHADEYQAQMQAVKSPATEETPKAETTKTPDIHKEKTKEADKKKTPDPFKGMPKSGIISSSMSGVGSFGVQSIVTSKDLEGKGLPISGTVINQDNFKRIVKITNNSDKAIKITARLIQTDSKGQKKLRSDYLSMLLKPKSSVERVVTNATESAGYVLELKSWSVIK
jgi:hypothetical protein